VLSGRGLCDELITRSEESYLLCCVVVCDLETSRIGAPYIYNISSLRVSSNRSPIRCNNFSVYYPDVYLQLNMFRAFSRPSSGAQRPEAATAVVELLMMGGRTPETCWAVDKSQDNKLKNCYVRLVIYLNCMMMHGLTNLKFIVSCHAMLRSQEGLKFTSGPERTSSDIF